MNASSAVPNLINGVSQQADALRFPSQVEEQENVLASILRGAIKRPPTVLVAALDPAEPPA